MARRPLDETLEFLGTPDPMLEWNLIPNKVETLEGIRFLNNNGDSGAQRCCAPWTLAQEPQLAQSGKETHKGCLHRMLKSFSLPPTVGSPAAHQ